MDPFQFVKHARDNNFTVEQVKKHFPGLPNEVCAGLLAGTAWVDSVNPDGSVVVDDGK